MTENETLIIVKLMGLDPTMRNGKFACKRTRLFMAGWEANELVARLATKHRTRDREAAELLTRLRNDVNRILQG